MSTRRLKVALIAALSGLLAFGAVTLPQGPAAEARTIQELEDQRQRNARERAALQESLKDTDAELSELYLALDETRRELQEARFELEIRNEELAAAERELQSVRDRLEVARAQKEELEEAMAKDAEEMQRASAAMGEVARSAYQGTGSLSTLSVVLNAGSMQEFADSYSAMDNALRNQGSVLSDLKDGNVVNENLQARLEGVEDRIAELEVEAEELVAYAEEMRAAAEALVASVADLEARQEAQAEEFEKFIADGEKKIEKLKDADSQLATDLEVLREAERKRIADEQRRQREEAARKERERLAEQAARPSNPAPAPAPSRPGGGSGTGGRTGALIPPISSPLYVNSPWGYRIYPISGGWWMHNGVDLRSPCGERQFASAAGTVTSVRPAYGNGTHGNQVWIDHGTLDGAHYVTVYNHLSGFAVSQGQRVSQGQTIGWTGITGVVTGCHVHFEVWRNGQTIDPMTLPAFR